MLPQVNEGSILGGRGKKSRDPKKNAGIALNGAEMDKLQMIADRWGTSRSEVISRLLQAASAVQPQ